MSNALHNTCHVANIQHYWLKNMAPKEVSGPSLTSTQGTVGGDEASGGSRHLRSLPTQPGDLSPFRGPCPGGDRAQ